MTKRLIDLLISTTILIVAGPVIVLVAWLIKRNDGGPILYAAPRVGLHGHMFRMYKFRTMVVNADEVGGPSTSDRDPRITPIGAKLRRFKLDELPQFFNVIRGDMSIVGPRPEVQHYVDMFSPEERAILDVKPGITDLATLWNSDEGALLALATDPEEAYLQLVRPKKVALQLEYVSRASLALDLLIILRTVKGILFRDKPPALDDVTPGPGSSAR